MVAADPNYVSAQQGNMQQMVDEFRGNVTQTESIINDHLAAVKAAIPPEMWTGAAQAAAQVLHQQLTEATGNMNAIVNYLQGISANATENWPAIDNYVAGLMHP